MAERELVVDANPTDELKDEQETTIVYAHQDNMDLAVDDVDDVNLTKVKKPISEAIKDEAIPTRKCCGKRMLLFPSEKRALFKRLEDLLGMNCQN